jgi:hypothetical protein
MYFWSQYVSTGLWLAAPIQWYQLLYIGKTILNLVQTIPTMIPTSSRSTDLGGRPKDCPFFSFCEQTLKMGANDASGQGLQSTVKIRRQTIFFKKIMGI